MVLGTNNNKKIFYPYFYWFGILRKERDMEKPFATVTCGSSGKMINYISETQCGEGNTWPYYLDETNFRQSRTLKLLCIFYTLRFITFFYIHTYSSTISLSTPYQGLFSTLDLESEKYELIQEYKYDCDKYCRTSQAEKKVFFFVNVKNST